ncbi:hypothetical protein [Schlesneria sp.]|uniref:hypothetical protein n=1 Tax=Schlesneria sp. TaxID=2762018 RepID=UPI002F03134C
MNWTAFVGRRLGYSEISTIESIRISFGSAWAHPWPGLVVLGCLGLSVFTFWFYLQWQPHAKRPARLGLAVLRSLILSLVLLIVADPTLELALVSLPKPVLWFLLDGSDSMSIADELPEAERSSLATAVDLKGYRSQHPSQSGSDRLSRADYTRAWLHKADHNLIDRLSDSYRLRFFSFGETDGVRILSFDETTSQPSRFADWQTTGRTTPLGDAFEELARQHASDNVSAVVVVSDFGQNSGTSPLEAAKKLGVPIFTVGVGPVTAVDLSLDLIVPQTIKKSESSTIIVTVRQRELENTPVSVQVYAHQAGEATESEQHRIPIGERQLTLAEGMTQLEFPFTPDVTGRYVVTAEVDPVEGEVVTENNRATREVSIIDDFLRLMFVEYEPTWEWRFVKEIFHRDKLVGTRGFRTFLRSADPVVRETNELFLPNLTLPRSQFFENDVIFLGDMPASTLSERFCEMTREFVSQFGGGLVVIAGPRFGPGQLAETALADMLPVVVDGDLRRRDNQEFHLNLTPIAGQFDFMRMGTSSDDPLKGWNNLGKLPWYQPVRRVEARGTQVLAEHPLDKCSDARTPQPLIAIRQYGRGEVVYIAFNEMWRLRRLRGEEFYRQFWGQLIHRLGLGHALGSHKRFVVRTDKKQYRPEEQVRITVEAYDKEFRPLDEKEIPERRLCTEWIQPQEDAEGNRTQIVGIPPLRPGIFETRLPVTSTGEYRVRVTDPVTGDITEINFDVANQSIERQSPIRNALLQKNLAAETGGKDYDLRDVDRFIEDYHPVRQKEISLEIIPLWTNWFTFGLVLVLLLAEWLVRKLVNLA